MLRICNIEHRKIKLWEKLSLCKKRYTGIHVYMNKISCQSSNNLSLRKKPIDHIRFLYVKSVETKWKVASDICGGRSY